MNHVGELRGVSAVCPPGGATRLKIQHAFCSIRFMLTEPGKIKKKHLTAENASPTAGSAATSTEWKSQLVKAAVIHFFLDSC